LIPEGKTWPFSACELILDDGDNGQDIVTPAIPCG
jgi:hypothetical protein